MPPASDSERRRLNDLFAELCAIPSPFGHEAACAKRVREELESLGLHVSEDGAAAETGAACGSRLVRPPARLPRSVLPCAHLDTAPVAGDSIQPTLADDGWESGGDTTPGADNKAAVPVMLAAARGCAVESSPVGLELLF